MEWKESYLFNWLSSWILALQELQMARMEMGRVQEMLQTSKEAKDPEAKETVNISS